MINEKLFKFLNSRKNNCIIKIKENKGIKEKINCKQILINNLSRKINTF